jgi:hypothetical protein
MADEKTSTDVAKRAGRVLRDPAASSDEKSVAASALSQAADHQQTSDGEQSETVAQVVPVEEKKTVLLQFAEGKPEPGTNPKTGEPLPPPSVLELGHGEYSRRFLASEQPFKVEAIEEAPFLLSTGLFIEVPVEVEAPPVQQ